MLFISASVLLDYNVLPICGLSDVALDCPIIFDFEAIASKV
ncbi:hypothetical protein [Okeania sp. SIO2G5]|nr:hypothetical protein [Okeania sp. SIO2G5]